MAMEKSHEAIKKQHGQGHNSGHVADKIKELAVRYAKADEQSMTLNDERAKIREEIADLGLDTKAWQDEIGRAKRDLKKKDGYDESVSSIRAALGDMNMEDLFAHVARKEREKEETRAAKAKEREKEKADAKAAEKAAKPAKEPKAKKVTGKDAAAGEGLSTGEAQAQAMLAAGHGDQSKAVN